MRLERTVRTTTPIERVFAYLADFTTTNEWDPGTVRTTRVSGDGGTEVHYRADFDFGLLGPVVSVVLRSALRKLGDEAARGMAEALDRLGPAPSSPRPL